MFISDRKSHPVYLTLGNIWRKGRQVSSGRRILSFIPTVRSIKAHKNDAATVDFKRQIMMWAMGEITKPIVEFGHSGRIVHLGPQREPKLVIPRMVFLCGDHPGISVCVVCGYSNSATIPCHCCLVIQPRHQKPEDQDPAAWCKSGPLRDIDAHKVIITLILKLCDSFCNTALLSSCSHRRH